ncbi:hypothetical protein RRG08_007084 [Elysia crispata]|uniref:Uncharacterized protein n=1 Tax=Elysia crispata TaxID=231223 RepID=A0AAE1D2U5_9GAST|nr:hypothetical protein RRG08_007084 [Elysia crispata]
MGETLCLSVKRAGVGLSNVRVLHALNAIKEIADTIRQHTIISVHLAPPASVAAVVVSFKAPELWPTNANVWFLLFETIIATHTPAISNDTTRFHFLVQLLDFSTSRRGPSCFGKSPSFRHIMSLLRTLSHIPLGYRVKQFQKDTALLGIAGLGDRRFGRTTPIRATRAMLLTRTAFLGYAKHHSGFRTIERR